MVVLRVSQIMVGYCLRISKIRVILYEVTLVIGYECTFFEDFDG